MRKQQFIALMYGWIVVLGLILLSSIILAFLLRFTTMGESTLSWVTLAVGLICLFIGGIVAGIKGKQKGWIIGSATGLGFTLFTFLVQYLGYQQVFTMEQSLHHLGFIVAALIGGVLGVNMGSAAENN
ncbi:TIGR04086 family membrane protein [Virgibacillus doumboii]|uniref:TIGR04086 family membrane protein n=1 Tax=Virgibacillus doumboii TaxID=2697503 RepID=UPI0013E09DE9|nr:TIGR04086 family membrane protein [Virgibacillus doumboii]